MRVYQFITLFLALGIACGCSHRRAQRQPVAASLCDCSACRYEQERLISAGAVPAEHFENSAHSTISSVGEPTAAKPVTAEPSELSPEYTVDSGNENVEKSPFSSGNPIEMDEPPQLFNVPAVDKIESLQEQIPSGTLELTPDSGSIDSVGQQPGQSSSENVFQPFNRDVFKVKSETTAPVPLEQQPSILIDKVSETSQPDLGAITPPSTSQFQLSLSEPSSSDFEIPDSIVNTPVEIEPKLPEIVEPEVDAREPRTSTFEPVGADAMPDFASTPPTNTFEPVRSDATPDFASTPRTFVPEKNQPTETVVEGQLYENPVVLYARPRRGQLIPSPAQTPGAVQPASIQKPVEHQGIAQNSKLDPVYGLPLNNQVQFNSLPVIEEPQLAPVPAEAQHLHVHIHHDYGNNAGLVQGPVAYQNGQPAANVQVVYRDDKGRVIMAPPTPTTGVAVAVPTGDQRTYYVPPKQILRLKAVAPIDQPRSNPSVASIQMRDTVVYGGTHLLTKPEYQAQAAQTNHGLPGIDHEKLREAFKNSPSGRSLR